MASATVSIIFAVVALLCISLAVLLLLRYFFPLRTSPAFLVLPVFLALALPASIILLLPIDIASSARREDETSNGIWLPERAVLVTWRIAYWLTFGLTWIVLPLLGEYVDSGYRDPKARIIYSLRSNGRYQLIVLGCSIVGLVYMIISYGFDLTAIKGLVMALAYCWGLVLAIYLMGHGLVAVPRGLFRRANISARLRRIQSDAPRVHEKLDDAITSLEEIEAQVLQLKQRKTGTALDFKEWIDDLAESISIPESRAAANPGIREAAANVPVIITERYLADLSRRLTRGRDKRARYIEEWDRVVQSASDLQTMLDSKPTKKLTFSRPSPSSTFLARATILPPTLRYHLYVHIYPALSTLGGILTALLSFTIIETEVIKPLAPNFTLVSFVILAPYSSINFGSQLVSSLFLSYMCLCALFSITAVPVWYSRALVHRHTSAESAAWYAGQIAKLTVPLSYNFLTFLPKHIGQQTTFYNFLGRLINLTPLGKGFDYFFPMFILIPVLVTCFNLYGKVKRVFGFGWMDDLVTDEDSGDGHGFGEMGWREGRDLIARDLDGPVSHAGVGLLDSPRASLDQSRPRPARAEPTRWVPPAEPESSTSRILGSSEQQSNTSRPRTRRTEVVLDPEPEEENFFVLLGRRMKNTVDGISAPKWMVQQQQEGAEGSSSGGGGFKRPKWMGGSGDGGSRGGLTRLFGGSSADDGRLRI